MQNLVQDSQIVVEIEKLKVIDQPMTPVPDLILTSLKKSIEKYGIKEPIRINENYEIIAGRHRHMIAKELGMSHVPCVISDTKLNPDESVLKYDLEIYRRQLTTEEYGKYDTKRHEYLNEIQKQTFKDLMTSVTPELHESVTKIFNSNKNIEFLRTLASLSSEDQKALIKEVEVVFDNTAATQKLSEMKELTKQLQQQVEKFSHIEEKYKEEVKKTKILENGLRGKINERIEEKEAEIAEKYKTQLPDEIQQIIDEESNKTKALYENELDDLQENLRQMSKKTNDVAVEKEILHQKLNDTIRAQKDAELYKTKIANDLKARDILLLSLVKPEKFKRRFELIYEELNNLFLNLLEIGAEETIENNYKESYLKSLLDAKNVIEEIEKLVKV